MNFKGKKFEKEAEKFLKNKKYEIIAKNFVSKFGEIDIIAKKDEVIHFIEVKGRKDEKYMKAEESVDFRKIEKIKKTAKFFLLKNPKYCEFLQQFDVITIVGDRITFLENCFF